MRARARVLSVGYVSFLQLYNLRPVCAGRVSPACLGVSGDVHVHVTGMKGRGRYHTTFAACRTRDGARTTPLHEHTLDPRRARKPTRLSGHTPLGNKQMAEGSTGSRRPCARAVPSSRALLSRKLPSSRRAACGAHPPFSMESETETGLREHLPARGRGATGGQRCRLPE